MKLPDPIAIAWYSRDEYEKVRALDEGGMFASFDEWKAKATQELDAARALGLRVVRVQVKARELAPWLAASDLKNNEQARARFVHDLVAAKKAHKA